MNERLELPKVRPPPTMPGSRLLGVAPRFLRDPLGVHTASLRYGPLVTLQLGPRTLGETVIAVNDPDGVQHVLGPPVGRYAKNDRAHNELRRWFGDGLFTVEGPRWKVYRRTIQPLFRLPQVASFDHLIYAEVDRLLTDRWEPSARRGAPVDVHRDLIDLTLRVVSRVLLSGDADRVVPRIANAFPQLNRHSFARTAAPVVLPDALPFPGNLRARVNHRRIFSAARQVVRDRVQRASSGAGDLLDRMRSAVDPETDRSLTEVELVDNLVHFWAAGHETAASSLTVALHMIGRHPEVQERLDEEVDTVLGGDPPRARHAPQLRWTAHVFEETLRCFPTIWAIPRTAQQDDEVCGYRVPADATVVLPQWVIHRDPRWWDRPERFLPERWLDEDERTSRSYFPFGVGPRMCVGRHLARLEAMIFIAAVAQRFRLRPAQEDIELHPVITLRPRDGVRTFLELRDHA